MGHLTPVLVATESFGRDMRKILTRYRAPPELIRELEQNFTVWKASIRQFHDAACPHTSVARSELVKSSALARLIGEAVVADIVDDVCERRIPQLEINDSARKLAQAAERIRILEIQVKQQDATNEVMQAQNDRQADSQLSLAHSMFEEVFQLRTTIAELTAIALDPTGSLAEKYSREPQKSRNRRNRADSVQKTNDNNNNNMSVTAVFNQAGAASMMDNLGQSFQSFNNEGPERAAASSSSFLPPSDSTRVRSGSRGPAAVAINAKKTPIIDIVKTDFVSPSTDTNTVNVDVRSVVKPVREDVVYHDDGGDEQQQQQQLLLHQQRPQQSSANFVSPRSHDSNVSFRRQSSQQNQQQNDWLGEESLSAHPFVTVASSTNQAQQNQKQHHQLQHQQSSLPPRKCQASVISSSEGGHSHERARDSSVDLTKHAHHSLGTPATGVDNLSAAGRRRINPKSGGVGPYAIFDYETFIENFEKTRGAKALAQQLDELQAAFAAYVEKSNLDRAGIASSFQFQLDAKNEQIAALKLALLQALGTAPTLAKMVRSFLSRVLKIELEQVKKRMRHLQQAVKVWIEHILKHVHVMGARFDVFVRFCGNIFQELADCVSYAVQQRFPLAPGATPAPPPTTEPLWHFFVLKGDDDPEEEAKAYWQNHEATQSIALLHINMCEALKEVHYALRLAAQLKNPFKTSEHFESSEGPNYRGAVVVAAAAAACSSSTEQAPSTTPATDTRRKSAHAASSIGSPVNSSRKTLSFTLGTKKVSNLSSFSGTEVDDDNDNDNHSNSNNNHNNSGGGERSPTFPKGIKKLVSFSSTAKQLGNVDDDDQKQKQQQQQQQEEDPSLSSSSNYLGKSATGRVPTNRFPLRKRPVGQHTITFSDGNAEDPFQALSSNGTDDFGGRKRKIRSLYSGTSWEALDSHRQGIEKDFGDGGLFQRSGVLSESGAEGGPNASWNGGGHGGGGLASSLSKGGNPNILQSLDQWTQNMGGEMFLGSSYSQIQQLQKENATAGAKSASPSASMLASSLQRSPSGGRRGRRPKYDDWTIETSVENVKFLRGLSKRCVQLSVRCILSRVHLRARRQLLLRKMPAEQRNAYLSVAALDREIAHLSDVIDGCRGNGYLAKFRAVETEQIIQAWKSTGRRGKPVITGDSDEDDPRVLPVHAPNMVPLRSVDSIRGKKGGDKSKDSIQKFRLTLGQTGGTSNALEAGDDDDGTLGDPVKLVQDMITTGTLWAQSSLGKDTKGAYRARQDVLYELIDRETQRMKSSDGFKTRRKRRFLRMLNYLKNKIGFAESAINAARSGTTSTAVQEGTTLLQNFVDNFGVPDEEAVEIDELDPANKTFFLSRSAGDIRHLRGTTGGLSKQQRSLFGNNTSGVKSADGVDDDDDDDDGRIEVGDNNNNNNGQRTNESSDRQLQASSEGPRSRKILLKTAKAQLNLSLAGDGSNRWKYSRREGGAIHDTFDSIEDTILKNRSDILSLQRLGLTEDQIKLMQIQSLRGRARNPPKDLKEFLMSTINLSYATDNKNDDFGRGDGDVHARRKDSKATSTQVLDEAMEKLRDDLFFGRNNTDLWFGMNESLWIPTPGQDLPQELKDTSRDVALRRAMAALLAVGALSSLEDDDKDNDDDDDDEQIDEVDEEQAGVVGNVFKSKKQRNGTVSATSLSPTTSKALPFFAPSPPASLKRKRISTTTFNVQEASVERTDGDTELGEAFSTRTLNPPKIIESEAPAL